MCIRSYGVPSLLLLFPSLIFAPQKKTYLDPNDGFSTYFSSAIQKKKVPVAVTTGPQQAGYTAQFQAEGQRRNPAPGDSLFAWPGYQRHQVL